MKFYFFSASKKFFFNNFSYALTFSGRAPLFKEELDKVPTETQLSPQENIRRVKPIGRDFEYNSYIIVFMNKDCRLYKETDLKTIELIVKNYEELEIFISKYENSKNQNELSLIKNIKDNLLKFKEND